jgi:hypothetical protein
MGWGARSAASADEVEVPHREVGPTSSQQPAAAASSIVDTLHNDDTQSNELQTAA